MELVYLLIAISAVLALAVAYLIPPARQTRRLRKNIAKAKLLFDGQQKDLRIAQNRLKQGEKGYGDLLKKWNEVCEQTKQAEQSIADLSSKNQTLGQELEVVRQQSVNQIETLQKENARLLAQQKEQSSSLKELEAAAKKPVEKSKPAIDPHEFLKLKRKCRDYARLLKGTKGLREMSDARADNMQSAAIQLARAIHGQDKGISESQVIAQALEKVGGSFLPGFEGDAENENRD
jgi:predicted  nucleic acid-binding Zn-ribbon protein